MASAIRSHRAYDQRRSANRHAIDSPSTVRDHQDVPIAVQVADLSCGGCRIETVAAIELGGRVEIGLPAYGSVGARIVRRQPGGYGCEFLEPLTPAAMARAFSDEVVVAFPGSLRRVPDPDFSEAIPRLPGAVRAAILFGGSGLLWGGVLLIVRALVA